MKNKGIFGGIIVVVLILVLTLAVGGGSVSAEEPTIIASGNCGKAGSNVTWTLDSTGLLTISGEGKIRDYGIVNSKTNAPWVKYRDKLFDLNIETGVTVIGASAFAGCNKLSGVSLSDSITSIGDCAFFECSGLTVIEISKNVTSIGSQAFENCTGLTSVTIPNGVTSIGGHTFDGCSNLLGIVIPDCVTSIGAYAFNNCSRLTNVTIPQSVTNIGSYAFCGCSSLSSVLIPESVTNIGYLAFKDTPWIASLGEYAIINNILVAYQGNAADAIIPKEVTAIGGYAFQNCAELTNVIMSDGITAIGNSAFYNCSGLTSITMPNSVVSIGNYAFYGCSGLTSIIIPESVTSIGQNSFCGCSGLTDVQYNAKSAIDQRESDHVFGKAGILGNGVQLTIGDSVERIPAYLFYASSDYRNNIIGVTIGKNVTSIGKKAFSNCGKLNSLVIGESVSSIGVNAFAGCSKLVELQYNARAVIGLNISSGVFSYSGSGMKVTFGDGVEEIPSYLFHDDDYAYGSSPEISSVTMGDGVTSIGNYAFYGCEGLSSVTIPNSVTSIGYCAFIGCRGLTSVTIPDSVTSIGQYAFSDCTGLTEIIYNAKAAADLNSGSKVFYNAGSSSGGLRVVIGDSVERIPAYLFYGCTGLTEIIYNAKAAADLNSGSKVFYNAGTSSGDLRVVIGDGVDKIPAYLFHGCTGLTSVTIPDSVTSIGYWAFKDCNNIEKVHISDIAAWCGIVFGSYESNPLAYAKDLYVNDALVTDLTIPNGVTSIGQYAFSDCTGLTSVTIPNSVTSIGSYAFKGCTGLTSVTIPNSVASIGSDAFYGCTGLAGVTIPDSVTSIEDGVFYGCTGLASVTIPDSVTSIGRYAFHGCTGLTEILYNAKAAADLDYYSNAFSSAGTSSDGLRVIIGDGVKKIPDYLFSNCTGLISVTIPDSVTSIGDWAFYGCEGLTSVTIPNGVTSIGSYAFKGCTGLTSVTIPDSVTSIGENAFSGCTGLTSVTIGNGVTSIGSYAFSDCSNLTSVYFNAKECADFKENSNVFSNAGKNTEGMTITFGKNVKNIPSYLCYASEYDSHTWKYYYSSDYAPKVKGVKIENGVQSIGDYAFYSSELAEVTIPGSVVNVGKASFCGCSKLTDLTILDGVTNIGNSAFENCTSLTSVTIGNGVTSIGYYAFSYCPGLTSVEIPNSVTSIGNNAFSDCTGLTSVTIPDSVTSIGRSAFRGCIGLISATIGNSVTSIGRYAFEDCSNLTSVYFNANECADFEEGYNVFSNAGKETEGMTITFGKNVQNIPSYLCYASKYNTRTEGYDYSSDYAPNVKKIIIADGVQNIGQFAFYGCTGLTSVTIPGSMTSIGGDAFADCTGLTSVTIPDSVTSIGDRAFEDCTGLTSVTIGNSVTSIGRYAFHGCTGLTEILYNAKAAADLDYYSNAFSSAGTSSDGLRAVIGNSVEQIPACLFSDCIGLTSVTIGNSVTSIGRYAFEDCTGLTSVTIPNSVTSIGSYAFKGCTGLTSVTIPDSVTSIGENAFSGCTGLTSVTIPDSVTSIGDGAFSRCTGLTSVTIPSSVESIGSLAFSNCSQLKNIFYGGSELAWKLRFSNVSVSGNTTVHFEQPTGQILVSGNCGTDGDNLTWTINDRGNLTVSGKGAMKDYTQSYINYQYVNTSPWGNYAKCLYSAVIENGVTSIGDYAFAFCKNLKSVTIGEDVSNFGSCAFRECSNLEELNYNAKAAADLGTSEYVFDCAGNSGNGICVWVGERVKKIPRDLFCGAATYFSNHANLRCVFFKGNPPIIDGIGLVSSRSSVYAFYPYGNSEWTASARNSYGSKLIWSAYSDAPATAVSCKTNKTVYLVGETLDVSHLVMTVTHEDGCVETIPYASGLLTLGEYDLTTPGAKSIPVTGRGAEGKLSVYVHEQKTETLDKAGYPESSHDYENDLNKTYAYKAEGAFSLDVTFSAQTEVETNIDYLYVNGTKYTGTELAGKTITISGDTLTIRLVSDKSDSAYGFSIDSIVMTYMGHEYEDTVVPPTCTEQGYTLRSCPCGSVVKQNYVDALGHDMVTDAAVAPTCTKTGLTEGSHCARCDEATTAQKVVPALGHDMVTDAAVAPTCTKTGLTEGSHCSRCDDQTTAQEVIPARGHRFNARHICMVCGVEDPVVEITLKKLPTKASYVVNKEALDVAGGVVLSHYESGETEELELTAAMVSGFDNTILGKQTLTVTVGGLTTTFEVEVVERAVTSVTVENGKLVKHYTDGTTEETPLKDGAISDFAISETGEKTLTLTSENACVAAYKDADGNYVALKAVANEDGSYSYVVPEEVTEVTVAVKGDLDGDGRINMKDLAQLRRNMAEGTVEGGLEQLLIDFNGDGVVNMKDMGLLRRYLAGGYDIELGW